MLLRGEIDLNIYNEREEKDLEEMTYVDKYGRNDHGMAFISREDGCARRYHMKYGRGVVAKGEI